MTQMCMLHLTGHYIDILQEMLLSLMLFCGKFIKVYVCQKLLKYSLVWQTYGKNKTVQFFASQCTCDLRVTLITAMTNFRKTTVIMHTYTTIPRTARSVFGNLYNFIENIWIYKLLFWSIPHNYGKPRMRSWKSLLYVRPAAIYL